MALSVASAPVKPAESPVGRAAPSPARTALFRMPGQKVKPRDLTYFTSQLSLMMEVGTPLTDALRALARQTTAPYFKGALTFMQRELEEGRQLSDAMSRYPDVFDGIYVSMVRAGETGGFLKDALDRIAAMQERRQALASQVKSALTYPAVLCVMALAVIVFILTFVLPKFTVFFEGKEHILPVTTRLLSAMSASMREYWWAYGLGTVVAVIGFMAFWRSPVGRALRDAFLVRAPVINRLANKVYTCQLLRTLGHLMESQVPLLDALEVAKQTMQNRHYKKFVDRIARDVEQGGRLSKAFMEAPHIMDSVRQMVATGEESGNLYPVMLRLATFYDTEVEQEMKTVAAMIEPLALIFLGSTVGLILASVILPMFKLAHAL